MTILLLLLLLLAFYLAFISLYYFHILHVIIKGAASDSEERELIVESHFQVVKHRCFGLVVRVGPPTQSNSI